MVGTMLVQVRMTPGVVEGRSGAYPTKLTLGIAYRGL
jgi:hypothetical protein